MVKKDDHDRAVAILSYFLVGIIWYFVDDEVKNAFTKHHVKQALNLIIISVVGNVGLVIIPFLGWVILPFFQIFILILIILGIINAINGSKKEIPIIGSFAEKYLKF